MTGRRKGTPCACETDPCSCGSSKGKCVRAVNNVSPDPNGDLNLIAGSGIGIQQTGDDEITIVNTATPDSFVAGRNIELNPDEAGNISIDLVDEPSVDGLEVNGDTQLNGDIQINGDIIQNGSAYETHAEKIFTTNDYIVTRDGAISALSAGDYSGFQVKKYDGTNDGRLVIDNTGTARVGDVGDEQPLLTRAEQITNNHLLKWDFANKRAVDSNVAISDINDAIALKVSGTGNIGSDTKPVKIVNGAAVAVTNELQTKLTPTIIKAQYGITVQRYGQLVVVTAESYNHGTPEVHTVFTDMPRAIRLGNGILMRNRQIAGEMYINTNTRSLVIDEYISGGAFGCLTYLTDE